MFWLLFPTLAVVIARKTATIAMGDAHVDDGSETTECRQILLPSRSILDSILGVTDIFGSEEEEEMCLVRDITLTSRSFVDS
jgi:hypothetical protein